MSCRVLISDEPQQAHLVSYWGLKMGSPLHDVNHDDGQQKVASRQFETGS